MDPSNDNMSEKLIDTMALLLLWFQKRKPRYVPETLILCTCSILYLLVDH